MDELEKSSQVTSLRRPAKSDYMKDLERQDKKLTKSIESLDKILSDYDVPETANDDDYGAKGRAEGREIIEELLAVEKEQVDETKRQTEAIEESNEIAKYEMNTAEEVENKLAVLTDRLKVKYDENKPSSDLVTTSSVLNDKVDPQLTAPKEAWMPQPMPVEQKPSTQLIDSKPKEDEEKKVEGAPTKANPLLMAVETVGSVATAGFKKVVGAADKISGMLFKFTVSQAAKAAMIAGAIFSIILSLDLLKIAWQAWGDKIMEKFDEFSKVMSEWWEGFKEWISYFKDFTGMFESLNGSFMAIANAWESGDWPALAMALGKTILEGLKTLEGVLSRVMTKVLSTILSKLGFDNAAKAVEGEGLQHYQNMTNNKLSDENQKKLAEEQLRREKKDNLTPTQRGKTSFLPDSFRKMVGIISEDEYGQIQAEKKDQAGRQKLSQEQQVQNVAATNEAREAIARFRDVAENANPDNSSQMAKLDKYKKEAQSYINKPGVALTPNTKKELQSQFDNISNKVAPKAAVKPAKSAESKDSQTAKSINKAEANKAAGGSGGGNTTNNVNSTIVKSNRNVSVQNPVTNTRAPGVFKATGVN